MAKENKWVAWVAVIALIIAVVALVWVMSAGMTGQATGVNPVVATSCNGDAVCEVNSLQVAGNGNLYFGSSGLITNSLKVTNLVMNTTNVSFVCVDPSGQFFKRATPCA